MLIPTSLTNVQILALYHVQIVPGARKNPIHGLCRNRIFQNSPQTATSPSPLHLHISCYTLSQDSSPPPYLLLHPQPGLSSPPPYLLLHPQPGLSSTPPYLLLHPQPGSEHCLLCSWRRHLMHTVSNAVPSTLRTSSRLLIKNREN